MPSNDPLSLNEDVRVILPTADGDAHHVRDTASSLPEARSVLPTVYGRSTSMDDMADRAGLLSYEVTNAVLGWAVLVVLLVAAIWLAFTGQLLWTALAMAVVTVGLLPPVISRRPSEMIAWEVLGLATMPILVRATGFDVGFLAYLAIAALSLAVAVELDAFTSVEMIPTFAAAFVVIVTMAAAGLWTIGQYLSDVYLGTSLLGSEHALMWDLVGATGVGIVAGVVFELYFRRLSPGHGIAHEPWGSAR